VASCNGVGLPPRDGVAGTQSGGDRNSPACSRTRTRNLEAAKEAKAAIALLAEHWPRCFAVFEQRRRPLKIGIHLDILPALAGAITPLELRIALRFYVGNIVYLRGLLKGAWRIDLDGMVTGVVTADEEAQAKARIAAIEAKAAARKQSQKAMPQPVQPKRDGLAELREAARRRKAGAP
jgi:sRNA-binding protein